MFKKALFTGLILLSSSASAGSFTEVPVEIYLDPDNGYYHAQGAFPSARYSLNDVESIGCGVRRFEGGGGWGFCQARDATNQYFGCATYDLSMMDSLSAASDNSFIFFTARDFEPDTGEEEAFAFRGFEGMCTMVAVSTQSQYIFDTKSTKGK